MESAEPGCRVPRLSGLGVCGTVTRDPAFSRQNMNSRDTASFGMAMTWTLVFSLWKEFTPTWNQSTSRILLQPSPCFAWFSVVYWKTCFWVCFCSSFNVVFIIFIYHRRTFLFTILNISSFQRCPRFLKYVKFDQVMTSYIQPNIVSQSTCKILLSVSHNTSLTNIMTAYWL